MEYIINAPIFKLLLNGTELPVELDSAFEEITLEDKINLPAMFVLKFNIVDFQNGGWKGIDLDTFKLGDIVKVSMGSDNAEEMMTGEIVALEPFFGESSYMEIRGYDKMHRLRFGKKRRSFQEMKDSEIASSMASDAGLSPQVDATSTVHPHLFQNNQSDFEFLEERARRLGYEMLVDDKKFFFRKSQEDKTPEITLEFGLDFGNFSARLKTLTQGSEVEVRAWDIKNKEEVVSKAKDGSELSAMGGKETGFKMSEKAFTSSSTSLLEEVIVDASEAENIAKAQYNIMLNRFLTGDGVCGGNPNIRAGKTIELTGLGSRFSGTYYVISTVHSINDSGYSTSFKVSRTGI